MVASDTVVGIVGAVVLVAVMAAVFVYEYNNPAEEGSDSEAAAEFAEHYASLDATEDLDGDGLANLADDDMDGDGTANGNDTDIGVTTALSGSRPQLLPGGSDAGQTFAFFIGTGSVHLQATVTYTSSTPSPIPATPAFTFDVRDEAGTTLGSATAARSGTTVTLSLSIEESQPAGNYTLVVRQTQPGTGGSFSGSLEVHYEGPSVPLDHSH